MSMSLTKEEQANLAPVESSWEDGNGKGYHGENYYGLPAVKPSYYGWKAATSYFAEGTAGSAQMIAAIFDLSGREEDRTLVRAGRYLALAGSLGAAALFIADLHTPSRWYNMLRIFRPTSLMSIGSWSLMSFGVFSGLTAGSQLLEDQGVKAGRWLARIFQVPAALAGGMVSLYTGTELEETSLPLWAKSFPLLAPLFFSSNAASAVSALKLATRNGGLSPGAQRKLDRLSVMARTAEVILTRRALRRWKKLDGKDLSLPLLYRFASRSRTQFYGILASIPIRTARKLGRSPRKNPLLLPLASLAAGLLLPAQVIFAGNSSGRHPEEYLTYARPEAFAGGKDPYGTAPGTESKRSFLSRFGPWGAGLLVGMAVIVLWARKGGQEDEESRTGRG